MLEFLLARGNYLLIIALMMTGLYITFAAQNLIKRLVGLSVFQTSVFLFYITLSKVAGGTAPILFGKDLPKYGYGEDSHGGDDYSSPAYSSDPAETESVAPTVDEAAAAPADRGPEPEAETAPETSSPTEVDVLEGEDASLMETVVPDPMTDIVDNAAGSGLAVPYEAVESSLYNVYSNPLPHVLILTAIVVGVATLAVGLAIIVRIREAYGTIEADEVRHIDIDVALAEEAEDTVPEGAA
ncbi:MAG: cation:proton antiporter subunit C [Pseudomonadota bacterium]